MITSQSVKQEFLTHLADFFCMCMFTNVLPRAKMAQLSGKFIYPVAHLSGVHCIYISLSYITSPLVPSVCQQHTHICIPLSYITSPLVHSVCQQHTHICIPLSYITSPPCSFCLPATYTYIYTPLLYHLYSCSFCLPATYTYMYTPLLYHLSPLFLLSASNIHIYVNPSPISPLPLVPSVCQQHTHICIPISYITSTLVPSVCQQHTHICIPLSYITSTLVPSVCQQHTHICIPLSYITSPLVPSVCQQHTHICIPLSYITSPPCSFCLPATYTYMYTPLLYHLYSCSFCLPATYTYMYTPLLYHLSPLFLLSASNIHIYVYPSPISPLPLVPSVCQQHTHICIPISYITSTLVPSVCQQHTHICIPLSYNTSTLVPSVCQQHTHICIPLSYITSTLVPSVCHVIGTRPQTT